MASLEFNKRGINFQKVDKVEDFIQSFSLCNLYDDMREKLFKDYGVKVNSDSNHKPPDYDQNIFDMQVCLRSKKYLSEPFKKSVATSLLDGKPLDNNLVNLVDIARKQRKDNVLKSNDFFCGFKTRTLEDLGKKGNVNFKEQIRILIGSIEDPQQRLQCYDYWEQEKGKASYCEENFVDEILDMKYQLLQ